MRKKITIDTYIIVFFVVLAAALATYFIPIGSFETKQITYVHAGHEKTKDIIIPETFKFERNENNEPVKKGIKIFEPGGGLGFTNFLFEGLVSGDKWGHAIGLIAFLLIIGGTFGIIIRTSSVETVILSIIKKIKNYEIMIIAVVFFLFSLGGAIFGMAEETLPFLMVLIPLFLSLGYDSVTAIMVVFGASQIGFATSWMNPFSVVVAQGVASVPVMSGSYFRIVMWLFFTTMAMVYTLIYARKVKKNPKYSISYETDKILISEHDFEKIHANKFSIGDLLVILTLFSGISWVIWGVMVNEYYLPELAAQFFVTGFVIGVIGALFKLNKMTWSSISQGFISGATALLPAAIIIGMAASILLILGGVNPTTPTVLNTILHYAGSGIANFPSYISAWFMYLFQTVFNFFVVSGSGQAALTMPLMAPIADIAGITRQVAVLAFQLGDGFTNMLVPTSPILMGILGVAKIDWMKWAKFMIKFQLVLFFFGSLFVFTAIYIGYN